MAERTATARRLLQALPAAAALALAGCAHAPAADAGVPARDAVAPEPDARSEQPQRAFVTGSRLAQPVGRFGVPLSDSAVKVYYWRSDPTRAGFLDIGRAIPQIDLDAQMHPQKPDDPDATGR
jgi:hypothetical protein